MEGEGCSPSIHAKTFETTVPQLHNAATPKNNETKVISRANTKAVSRSFRRVKRVPRPSCKPHRRPSSSYGSKSNHSGFRGATITKRSWTPVRSPALLQLQFSTPSPELLRGISKLSVTTSTSNNPAGGDHSNLDLGCLSLSNSFKMPPKLESFGAGKKETCLVEFSKHKKGIYIRPVAVRAKQIPSVIRKALFFPNARSPRLK
mmetsp:Transcript_12509/g.22730  ORF Transcript_12509/g.22730 Transcript_12509/m.22730 type:complete len:204 (-) Transcript_12509:1227-1838(-)